MKMPIRGMTVQNTDPTYVNDLKILQKYIEEEINVVTIEYVTVADDAVLTGTLNFKVLGKKVGKDMKAVQEAAKTLTQGQLEKFEAEGGLEICGHRITGEEMTLTREAKELTDKNLEKGNDDHTMLVLDFTHEEDLYRQYLAREVSNRVQKSRKDAKLVQDSPVDMWAEAVDPKSKLHTVLETKGEYLDKLLRRKLWSGSLRQGHEFIVKTEDFPIEVSKGKEEVLRVYLTGKGAFFNTKETSKLAGGDASVEEGLKQYVQTYDLAGLEEICKKKADLKLKIGDKSFALKPGTHFVVSPAAAPWLKK